VYTDYSLQNDSLHVTLRRGQSYTMVVNTTERNGSSNNVSVWADFNANGVYEVSEDLGYFTSGFTFTVPATASLGPVRVRVRSCEPGNFPALGAGDACRNLGFSYGGEIEDYTFTVAEPLPFHAAEITVSGPLAVGGTVQLGTRLPLPAGTGVVWEGPGGFVSTQAQPTLTNLTAAQSGDYYLTAQTASGSFQLTMARRLQIGQVLANAPAQLDGAAAVSLYPNPTTGSATLHFEPAGPAYERLRVLSSTGQLIYTQPLSARDRGRNLPLDLRRQPRGLYLVQLVGSTGIISRKLLLE
jgi:hypothetical protein